MQEAPKDVTPGGPGATIDLAGAGVSRDIIRAAQANVAGGARGTRIEELEETDEVDEDELQERERALAELMGGGAAAAPMHPLGVDNAQGAAPSEERDTRQGQDREVFRLSETGGFLRGY